MQARGTSQRFREHARGPGLTLSVMQFIFLFRRIQLPNCVRSLGHHGATGESMLRKHVLIVAILAFLTPALLAQTVDEIIAKSVEARGGMDKLKSVKTIKSSGKM